MAKITTITNPLTGQPAQVDQLEHTAQEIDDAIARALPGGNIDTTLSLKAPLASPALTGTPTINGVAVATVQTISSSSSGVNPNLLDNWYFANPVNQRGQTTYTSSENQYSIDRWIKEPGTLTIADGYISLDMTALCGIAQRIETDLFKALAGKTLTASVLYKDGQLKKVTFTPDSSYTDIDIFKGFGNGFGNILYRWSNGSPNFTYDNSQHCDLVAIKLELGDQQTLAHQENGVWVLNEIPDYGEQLRRCQRYFYAFNFEDWSGVGTYWGKGTSSTGIELYNLTFPVTMRVNPSVKMLRVYDTVNGSAYDIGIDGYYNKKEGLRAIGVTSGMTVTVDRLYTISKAQFSADL